jgi:phosphofructokinase-like protein
LEDKNMKIGILTGGGDCPGLNAVIRAVVRKSILQKKWDVIGIFEGWKGLLEDGLARPITLKEVSGILHRGGTILKTSRTNPYSKKVENGEQRVVDKLQELEIDCLVVVGGEDTLGVAEKLGKRGIKVVGIPKTIDNDLSGTDNTFGYDTAINIAMEAIDRLHTTAESHNRVLVCEVMGRHAGWIAIGAGISGGADVILIPERPVDMDKVCDQILERHHRGKDFSIVVVAEGAKVSLHEEKDKDGSFIVQELGLDEFGHVRLGGIGNIIAREIEKRTGFESRVVILGHVQRGGSPSAFDRILATRFGVFAVGMIERGEFGRMVAQSGKNIISVKLGKEVLKTKTIDDELYETAEVFFA